MGSTPDQHLLDQKLKDWRPDHVGTLMFVRDADRVLLIRKKRGHGAGLYNGPGGKLDEEESPLAGAIRETLEETGVRVLAADLLGRFRFVDLKAPQWQGYAFLAKRWEGRPVSTPEADPIWFPVRDLPFSNMWEDDRIWLPRLLDGEPVTGDFLFDDGRLLAYQLRERGGET